MPGRYCALVLVIGLVAGCGGPNGAPAVKSPQAGPNLMYEAAGRVDSTTAAMTASVSDPSADVGPDGATDLESNTEAYDHITDNPFLNVAGNPLSTFSIDVDTASYSNVRRFLSQRQRPPRGAVRIEELVNYFSYDYPQPQRDIPFSVNLEVAACPWNASHRLARIGLKGREVPADQRPVSNLVFLIDVSGSMQDAQKLPLVKAGLKLLVNQLGENDRVALAVYAGASGLVLPSTTGDQKSAILSAIDNLQAGGSTNGGAGIELAYRTAVENFIKHGTNRVILCTDGDFNVGVTSHDQLISLIGDKARSGVFLTVLGFGMGNYKDSTLEKIADKGNGNYAYIDSANEAKKVFVDQLQGTLITIAKDVKLQIEFNPARVGAYRLIGYENRLLAAEDFNDDKKDAGEIGAGHTVTALYELIPAGTETTVAGETAPGVDALRYQAPGVATEAAASDELFTLKLRYKQPEEGSSQFVDYPCIDHADPAAHPSTDFTWAAAVAAFGMVLRDSPHKGNATMPAVLELAESARGEDRHGYRREFIDMLRDAMPALVAR